MRKRVLSWLLAITLTAGTLMPSSQAFAAENASELPSSVVAESGDAADEAEAPEGQDLSDGKELSEETTVTSEEKEKTAGDAESDDNEEAAEAEENKVTKDASDEGEASDADSKNVEENGDEAIEAADEEESAAETAEDFQTDNEAETEADAEAAAMSALTLEVRNADLMYGESADNKDGHLDTLFVPAVSDEYGNTYELKNDNLAEDVLTFTTSYKFYADRNAFYTTDSSFDELSDDEKAEAFKELEEVELPKAAAGTKLYAAIKAVTGDNKAAYAVAEVNIVKRPVALVFPATEDLSISEKDFPEDGILVVPADSELIAGISVDASNEYTFTVDGKELVAEGASDEELSGIPAAADIIAGDVTVDVSGLDLQTEGYQNAPANFELASDSLDNFVISEESFWPVFVTTCEVEDASETLLNDAKEPVKITSAKLDKTSVTLQYGVDTNFELNLTFTGTTDCDVEWNVDDDSVVDNRSEHNYGDGTVTCMLKVYGPGKAVVTASIGGVKSVTCNIFVNGTKGSDQPYFLNGKYLTGFNAFNPVDGMPVASGANALKMADVVIRYYDAVTLCPKASGTFMIANKLYCFDSNGELVRGNSNKDGAIYLGCVINKLGEVQTGWQKADDSTEEMYYSPVNGQVATYSWVPRGKGYTWVNGAGLMLDDNGIPVSKDGLHKVSAYGSQESFIFKGGLRQSGFYYFTADGEITSSKKAAYASYFQAPTGQMIRNNFFMLDGKKYYADSNGKISLSTRVKSNGSTFYTDASGAIVIGPKIAIDGEKRSFYVDKNGAIKFNSFVTLNGKIYFCNADGYIEDSSNGTPSDYSYFDDAMGNWVAAYIKLANAGKPSAGTFFYSDANCKTKLADEWLRASSESEPLIYLDKSGKLASGFCKTKKGIGYYLNPENSAGATYFFDPDNNCKRATSTSIRQVVFYKGNNYICTDDGELITDTSDFISAEGSYYRIKNSSGAVMTGVQTIKGKKYVFSENGWLATPNTKYKYVSVDETKKYLINPDFDSTAPATWYVYAPGKTVVHDVSSYTKYIFKKDGSLFTDGWVTVDGRKYYAVMGKLAEGSNVIVKIGGKYYNFNDDATLHTGWQKVSGSLTIGDLKDYSSNKYSGTYYFYFNAKTGALETGWKTMNALKTDADGKIIDSLGITGEGDKKKIYFNTSATSDMPIGALASNVDLTVSGKLYRFSADGSVEAGEESFVGNEPTLPGDSSSYRKADGTMARGRTLVKTSAGSYYYYFGLADGKKETNVIRKTGKKWYYYDKEGRMSTSLMLAMMGSGANVVASFNKDGSIKNFVLEDGSDVVVKNTAVECFYNSTKECYVLGSDGLPMTGPVYVPALGGKVFVEADGSFGGKLADDNKLRLRKVGSTYYMFCDGRLLDKTLVGTLASDVAQYDATSDCIGIEADDDVFDLLPASDRAEAAKCLKFRDAVMGAGVVYMVLNGDGSVKTGEVTVQFTGTCYANRFGIIKDSLSPFVKEGGWKVSAMLGSGEAGSTVIYAGSYTNEIPDLVMLRISWDDDGNLLPIIDENTGKKASGKYLMLTGDMVATTWFISVKSGKLATGNVTIKRGSYKATINIDKEFGFGIVEAYVH